MKKFLAIATIVASTTLPALANEGKADHWFDKIDADKSGSISKAEHDAFSATKFSEADMNKDGSVSRSEFKDFKMKEHGKGINHEQDPKKYNSKAAEREYKDENKN